MLCANCGATNNPEGSQFCNQCGRPLETREREEQPKVPRLQVPIALIIIGCCISAVSAFFPWVKYYDNLISGPELMCGLGFLPLFLGLASLGLLYFESSRRRLTKHTGLALLILVGLSSLGWIFHAARIVQDLNAAVYQHMRPRVQPGYLTASLGLLLWLLGSVMLLIKSPRR